MVAIIRLGAGGDELVNGARVPYLVTVRSSTNVNVNDNN